MFLVELPPTDLYQILLELLISSKTVELVVPPFSTGVFTLSFPSTTSEFLSELLHHTECGGSMKQVHT